jgi:hypothetical protein
MAAAKSPAKCFRPTFDHDHLIMITAWPGFGNGRRM